MGLAFSEKKIFKGFPIIRLSCLQCYSVLSTIAHVLRKMSFEILASRFLMPYLSQTFESYQRVRIYAYSVNDLGLKKFVLKYGIYGHFTVCR